MVILIIAQTRLVVNIDLKNKMCRIIHECHFRAGRIGKQEEGTMKTEKITRFALLTAALMIFCRTDILGF